MNLPSVYYMLVAVFAPVVCGVATLFISKRDINRRVLVAVAGPVVSFFCVLLHLRYYGIGVAAEPTNAIPWIPTLHLNIAFLTDGLGVFFALLVAGIGTLIVLYARAYFGKDEAALFRFYPTLGFFTSAMMGIVLADYMLLTVLFWEMTSISSFLLIGWDRDDKKAVKLAMQAFFTTGMGGLAMFGGVLLFGETTGVWRWSTLLETAGELQVNSSMIGGFILIFAGAAAKSAQWPFHYWLPGAMAAPTPVSAYLHSATMVKAGVFLIGRMYPAFSELAAWPPLVISFGAVTMLLGALLAINQHDLKRIFAYTTVSQLGLLVCMYGLGANSFAGGTPAIDWDITQIANHAFYKAPLFLIAGAIGHVAGTRELPRLFGFYDPNDFQKKAMVIVMLLAGYALAGGPGTVSFPAKEMFFYAVYHSFETHWIFKIIALMAIATAVCNVAIFVRLVTTFFGSKKYGLQATETEVHADDGHGGHGHEHEHETGLWAWMLWVPAAIIVALQYVGGLIPPIWNAVFSHFETNSNYEAFAHGVPWVWEPFFHPSIPLLMSAIAIGCGIALGLSKYMRDSVVDAHDRIYPSAYWLAVQGGFKAFHILQTGHIRHYLIIVFTAMLIGFAGAIYLDPTLVEIPVGLDPFEFWPGVLLGVIICATALLLPMVKERVVRVLVLGSCGFSVVGMYLIYQAPDLALTQLMFEIISVILFVLVLRLLPKPDMKPPPSQAVRALIGICVGVSIGWMTLLAGHHAENKPEAEKLGAFFKEHSHHGTEMTHHRGGEGKNIVNVILVDFRGFDTLGEISVLGIAALGVWSLLSGRRALHRKYEEEEATEGGT